MKKTGCRYCCFLSGKSVKKKAWASSDFLGGGSSEMQPESQLNFSSCCHFIQNKKKYDLAKVTSITVFHLTTPMFWSHYFEQNPKENTHLLWFRIADLDYFSNSQAWLDTKEWFCKDLMHRSPCMQHSSQTTTYQKILLPQVSSTSHVPACPFNPSYSQEIKTHFNIMTKPATLVFWCSVEQV